jgi:hypothetical protein
MPSDSQSVSVEGHVSKFPKNGARFISKSNGKK